MKTDPSNIFRATASVVKGPGKVSASRPWAFRTFGSADPWFHPWRTLPPLSSRRNRAGIVLWQAS